MSNRPAEKLPNLRRSKAFNVGTREDKLGLWSAVALQQHFALTVSPQSGSIDVHALPPPQSRSRLTLAQKMGLVPPPPSAPSDEEWKQIEHRASLRTDVKRIDESCCSICFEPFTQTMNQGQIILSCSHVFHEMCFKQFEKMIRQQQRAEGRFGASVLACPDCRQSHYHKRIFFAGKALAQRNAIIKIQSAIRGFLQRREYTKLRLKANSSFRDTYIQHRLQKLSHDLEKYLEQRKKEQEQLFRTVDAKKEEAIAICLSEEEWSDIINKRLIYDRLAHCDRVIYYRSSSSDENGEEYSECPICLERIKRRVQLQDGESMKEKMRLVTHGEEEVARIRREYEERKKIHHQKQEISNLQNRTKPNVKKRKVPRPNYDKLRKKAEDPSQCKSELVPSSSLLDTHSVKNQEEPRYTLPSRNCGERDAVILSCNHCFHDSCLTTFERYSQWQAKESGFCPTNRCPVCRSGYAVHPF